MSASSTSGRSPMRRIGCFIALALTTAVSLGLVASAWSSAVAPDECKYAVVMVMMFPAWLAATVAVLVIDLIFWRRTSLVAVAAMLMTLPWILDFCPLHVRLGGMSEEQQARSFTLMTYNVYQLIDQNHPGENDCCPQIAYVLEMDPDLVCLQEAEYLQPTIRNNVSQEQIDELNERYPYIFPSKEFCLLSKFPAEKLPFDFPAEQFRSGNIAGWRVTIDGRQVNVFNVHLRSLQFSKDQRAVFRDIVDKVSSADGEEIQRQELSEARHELIPMMLAASRDRAEQIKILQSYLRKFGGTNAIVCGDFNDPVGCYGLYQLEHESDMRQVYSEVGFGPKVTYNANNFYFRIDHILYRGDMKAWSIERGDLTASDHYPLLATFVFDE